MAGGSATLYRMGLDRSYRPPTGLAAARMDVRAFSVAWIQRCYLIYAVCQKGDLLHTALSHKHLCLCKDNCFV